MREPNQSSSTRWKPGQSGNPAGRPKRRTLVTLLRAELEKPAAEGSTATKQDDLVAQLVNLARSGDMQAIKLIFAYVEGQPIARTEQGEAGAFEDPLEDIPIETLRKALKRIK